MFSSRSDDYIGLGPDFMLPGDKIFLARGAKWPLLLRGVQNNRSSEQLERANTIQYRLVGECYVHGIMFGEFVKSRESKLEAVHII